MNVLSLFDGMSCGQIALKQLGIIPEAYYASEIDKHAIKQTQLNFPDTVQLGDVVFLRKAMCWRAEIVEKFDRSPWISEKTKQRFHCLRDIHWNEIDLILAGSPCQGFSFAGKQLAFDDPRSRLFFEFIHVLNHIRSLNPDVMFLLENVNMKKKHMGIISEYCGVFPVNINSNLVSAQNRDRWYWTNIRTKQVGLFGEVYVDIPQPEDRGIFLRDILESEVNEKYYLSQAVLNRMNNPHKCFTPKIDPDKTGCLSTGNNSAKMSFDSGTTFISVDGKAPTQRVATGRSFDKKHNYQFICVAMRGREGQIKEVRKNIQKMEPRYDGKTNCLTSVDKDNLILQRGRGNNKGGIFEGKTPTLSACSWEHNNLLVLNKRQRANLKHSNEKANTFLSSSHKGSQANGMTLVKDIVQLNPSKDSDGIQPYQQDRIYDVNGISPALCVSHGGMSPNVCVDRIRRLTPIECSRLQTIPDWYKWYCSETQQYKILGNGWTVEIIRHILKYLSWK